VLDPLLFLLINDKSSPVLFADDTNIICTHQDIKVFNDEIEIVFQKINRWLQANLLILNSNKTKIVHFSTKYPETTQTIQAYIKYEDICREH